MSRRLVHWSRSIFLTFSICISSCVLKMSWALMSFVLLGWKHRRKSFQWSHQPFLVGENFEKYRIWRHPDYWWKDWQWTLFDSQTQRLKVKLRKHKKRHKLPDLICSSQEAKPRLFMKRLLFSPKNNKSVTDKGISTRSQLLTERIAHNCPELWFWSLFIEAQDIRPNSPLRLRILLIAKMSDVNPQCNLELFFRILDKQYPWCNWKSKLELWILPKEFFLWKWRVWLKTTTNNSSK